MAVTDQASVQRFQRFLDAYPPSVQAPVRRLIAENRLGEYLARKYPLRHEVQTDGALYEYVLGLKQLHMKSAAPLHKVIWQNKLDVVQNVLGLHTTISRVQGGKLKARKEIRIASLFKETAPEFLEMVVVHELAHLREREHNKAFYQLCRHMLPDYHQLEFDLRLLLVQRALLASGSEAA